MTFLTIATDANGETYKCYDETIEEAKDTFRMFREDGMAVDTFCVDNEG